METTTGFNQINKMANHTLLIRTPHWETFRPGTATYTVDSLSKQELDMICTAHGVDRRGCSSLDKLIEKARNTTILNTTKEYNYRLCRHLKLPVKSSMKSEDVRMLLISNIDRPPQGQAYNPFQEASRVYGCTDPQTITTLGTTLTIKTPKATMDLGPIDAAVARVIETRVDEPRVPTQDGIARSDGVRDDPNEGRRPPVRTPIVGNMKTFDNSRASISANSASLWASKWAPKPDGHDLVDPSTAKYTRLENADHGGFGQGHVAGGLGKRPTRDPTHASKTQQPDIKRADHFKAHMSSRITTRLEGRAHETEDWQSQRIEPTAATASQPAGMDTSLGTEQEMVARELRLLAREGELLAKEKELLAREKELLATAQSMDQRCQCSRADLTRQDRRSVE